MKKISILMILIVILVSASSCFEDKSCAYPISTASLTINTPLSDTITADGYKFYTFQAASSGSYTISLTDLASDCDWDLYQYVSDCRGDYSDNEYIDDSSTDGTTAETKSVLLSSGKYLLVVSEFDDLGDSSYTVEVQY